MVIITCLCDKRSMRHGFVKWLFFLPYSSCMFVSPRVARLGREYTIEGELLQIPSRPVTVTAELSNSTGPIASSVVTVNGRSSKFHEICYVSQQLTECLYLFYIYIKHTSIWNDIIYFNINPEPTLFVQIYK